MRTITISVFLLLSSALVSELRAQPGSLDSGFGTGGRVTTSFGTGSADMSEDVALQSDGKIVAVGSVPSSTSGLSQVALARYNSNGTLDNTFGTGGKISVGIIPGFDNSGVAVKLQPDGKIVVAASANDTAATSPQNGYFMILRYNTNGTPDNSFGNGGAAAVQMTATVSPEVLVTDLIIQPDGKIIVSGGADMTGNGDMIFIRVSSTGALDASFAATGISIITAGPGGGGWPQAIDIQADGKIVFAGAVDLGSSNAPLLGRLTANGAIDNSFGTSGFVFPSYGFSSGFMGVAIQPDGKLVVCGFDSNGGLLARFDASGNADPAFGSSGSLIVPIGTQYDAHFNDLVIQSNGKIVAGGGADTAFALIRTTSSGLLDAGFGTGGIVQTGFASYYSDGKGMELQPDGKIILTGYSVFLSASTPVMFALARYNGDGPSGTGEDQYSNNEVTVYPNPSEGSLNVYSTQSYTGSIINSVGQLVGTFDITPGVNELKLDRSGVYFLRLVSGGSQLVRKVIVR